MKKQYVKMGLEQRFLAQKEHGRMAMIRRMNVQLTLGLLMGLSIVVMGCEDNVGSGSSGPVVVSSLSSGGESLSHQAVYTISGEGFGAKDPVAPFFWDDLSSSAYSELSDGDVIPTRKGDNGSVLDPDAPWWDQGSSYSNSMTYVTSNTRVTGHPNYRVQRNGYLMDLSLSDTEPEMFLSYWFRGTEISAMPEGVDYEYNEEGEPLSASNKMMRIWPDGNNAIGHISTYPGSISYDICCTAEEKTRSYADFYSTEGEWSHLQMYVNSTGHDNGEGSIETWENGVKGHGVENLWGHTNYYHLRLVGWEPNRSSYYEGQTYELGDIYFDNTQARVQVCNAATWAAVGDGAHCEMQIPKDLWSDTQISFTANLGDFASGEALFLYVIHSTGVVNAMGYSVFFE